MDILLHITPRQTWQQAQVSGSYRPESLDQEGFIHCSLPAQVTAVANERFAGQHGLMLLVIDAARVPAEIRYEDCYETGQNFPHIYGPLPVAAVVRALDFEPDAGGRFRLPEELPG